MAMQLIRGNISLGDCSPLTDLPLSETNSKSEKNPSSNAASAWNGNCGDAFLSDVVGVEVVGEGGADDDTDVLVDSAFARG